MLAQEQRTEKFDTVLQRKEKSGTVILRFVH